MFFICEDYILSRGYLNNLPYGNKHVSIVNFLQVPTEQNIIQWGFKYFHMYILMKRDICAKLFLLCQIRGFFCNYKSIINNEMGLT